MYSQRHRRAITLGLAIGFSLGGSADAWAYPLYPVEGLLARERAVAAGDRGSPGNGQGANTYLDETLPSAGTIGTNPNLWCPASDPSCNESNSGAPPTPAPLLRRTVVNSFSPMAGFHTTMNSMAYANQAAGVLVSPLAVLKVAWALTEPAVGLGTDAAMAQANMWLQNRYLADETFVRHAGMTPFADVILQSYRDCIGRAMGAAAPGLVGPAPQGASWVEAVSQCQGGETITPATTPFTAPTADGFQLADHTALAATGSTSTPNETTVLDLLFPAGNGQTSETVALRTSFEKLVGNVRLALGSGDSGSREIIVSVIPPSEPPETTYKLMTLEAYNTLTEVMYHTCQFHHGGTYPGTPPAAGAKTGNVYGSSVVRPLLERLSVKGFTIGERTADGLFRIFRRRYAADANPTCPDLKSWEAGAPTSLDSLGTGGRWAATTNELTRVYFAFARAIAMARYLSALMHAEMIVQQLSGGEYASTARRSMLAAIHHVAATSDLASAYAANLKLLRDLEAQVIQAGAGNDKDFVPARIG